MLLSELAKALCDAEIDAKLYGDADVLDITFDSRNVKPVYPTNQGYMGYGNYYNYSGYPQPIYPELDQQTHTDPSQSGPQIMGQELHGLVTSFRLCST